MTRLRLRTCVLLASLSNAHRWSEHKGLGRALFFQSHDFVHLVLLGQILLLGARHRCQRIHPQNWYRSMFFVNWSRLYWSMDRVNWMLILLERLHRNRRLSVGRSSRFVLWSFIIPWAYASLPLASHSASSLRLWFSFPSVYVDFRFFVATLNGLSRGFVVPRLLTPHRQMEVHVQGLNWWHGWLKSQPVKLQYWQLIEPLRILGFPDASYRNIDDCPSQRDTTVFLTKSRKKIRARSIKDEHLENDWRCNSLQSSAPLWMWICSFCAERTWRDALYTRQEPTKL